MVRDPRDADVVTWILRAVCDAAPTLPTNAVQRIEHAMRALRRAALLHQVRALGRERASRRARIAAGRRSGLRRYYPALTPVPRPLPQIFTRSAATQAKTAATMFHRTPL